MMKDAEIDSNDTDSENKDDTDSENEDEDTFVWLQKNKNRIKKMIEEFDERIVTKKRNMPTKTFRHGKLKV